MVVPLTVKTSCCRLILAGKPKGVNRSAARVRQHKCVEGPLSTIEYLKQVFRRALGYRWLSSSGTRIPLTFKTMLLLHAVEGVAPR